MSWDLATSGANEYKGVPRRSPHIQTFQEAGNQRIGHPAGAPAAIVDRVNGEIGKALADPAIRQNFIEADQEPVGGSRAESVCLSLSCFSRDVDGGAIGVCEDSARSVLALSPVRRYSG
jgi:hypothetical protein